MNEQLIAKLQLLIELAKTGEEFKIELKPEYMSFRFAEGLKIEFSHKPNEWSVIDWSILDLLFYYNIIRKPWKPKVDDVMWCWTVVDGHFKPMPFNCRFDIFDLHAIAFGNCFRTKEECELHTEVRDKLIAM